MNTVTARLAGRIDTDRFLAYTETQQRTSSRLAAAVSELAGYIRRQPDITLGELRGAFLGTGFEWGADGKLAFSPSRMALIHEFDDLIEIHGWGARAADLFL